MFGSNGAMILRAIPLASRWLLAGPTVAGRLAPHASLAIHSRLWMSSSVPAAAAPTAPPQATIDKATADPSLVDSRRDVKSQLAALASLIKMRLGSLVVVTTVAGFALAPVPFATGQLLPFVALTVGTSFCVASANTFNQVIEFRQDAIINRTFKRPIATGSISRSSALVIAITSGTSVSFEYSESADLNDRFRDTGRMTK